MTLKEIKSVESTNFRDCDSIFLDKLHLFVCFSGNALHVFNKNHVLIKKLQSGDQPIVRLHAHYQFKDFQIYAFHSDGMIVLWDLTTFTAGSQINLSIDISDALVSRFGYIILDKTLQVKLYSFDGTFTKDIFGKMKISQINFGGHLTQYLVGKYSNMLVFYWFDYDYVQKIAMGEAIYKKITSISCGKGKEIIAIGHRSGEITVIWNLVSDISIEYEKSKIVKKNLKWQPTPSEYLKRNTLHWHSSAVISLDFSSSDKQLISGGHEGVLVKWDLSEAIGDYKHMRFLPRLGAPISRIKCIRSSSSIDMIVVTLEDNSVKVFTMNFDPVFTISNLGQLPNVGNWRSLPELEVKTGLRGYTQSSILHFIDGNNKRLAIVSSGIGKLQVVNFSPPNGMNLLQNKINVTNEHLIPRDSKLKPAYSDCLLMDSMPRMDSNTESWLATYTEMIDWNDEHHATGKYDAYQSKDLQSRLSWWLFDHKSQEISQKPVDSHCLGFLSSPAIGLKFVKNNQVDKWHTLVMTSDSRLVIFTFDNQSFLTRKYSIWPYDQTVGLGPDNWMQLRAITRNNTAVNSFSLGRDDFVHCQTSHASFSIYKLQDLVEEVFPQPKFVWKNFNAQLNEKIKPGSYQILSVNQIKIDTSDDVHLSVTINQKVPTLQLVVLYKVSSMEEGNKISLDFVKETVLTTKSSEKFSLFKVHQSKPHFALLRPKEQKVEIYHWNFDQDFTPIKVIPNVWPQMGDKGQKSFNTEDNASCEFGLKLEFIPNLDVAEDDEFNICLTSLHVSKDFKQYSMDRRMRFLTTTKQDGLAVGDAVEEKLTNVLEIIEEAKALENMNNLSMNNSILALAKPVVQTNNNNLASSGSDIEQERLIRKRKMLEPINKILTEVTKFPSHLAPNPENILKQIYRQN